MGQLLLSTTVIFVRSAANFHVFPLPVLINSGASALSSRFSTRLTSLCPPLGTPSLRTQASAAASSTGSSVNAKGLNVMM